MANTVSNSSPDGLTKEQINDLKKMKVVLDEYAKTCSSEFSEEICEVFVKETQSDFENIFVFGADTGKLVLQLSGILDSKLVALLYDGFRTGILDYLDDDNVEVMKDIVEIGKVGVELLPYVGATAAYINSNAKASKEVRDAIGKEIAEYLLWSNEKQRLQKSILVKYELMVIANSINLIIRDTHFVFQEINPKRAVGKSVSPIAVIEATNYQIAQDKDLNKIIQYVRMAAKDNCMANGKQLVFTTNEFGNFIPISVAVAADCKTVTYSTLSTYHSETYTGIPFIATFNVKDNTVQYAPPDEKIYSDVNNGELNKYLLALTREGVLYGEEGKFHSGRPASKAEFYAMVARLFYPKDDWGQDASLGVRYKTFLESQLKQSFLSTEYTSDITYNEAADLVYRVRKHKGLEPETEKQLTDCETSLNWSKESYQLYDANILSLPKAYYKPPKIGVDIPDFTFKLCFNSSPKKEAKTAFMFPYDASMNRDQMAKLLYRAKYGKETW